MEEEFSYLIVGVLAILLSLAWMSMPFTLLLINAKLSRIERILAGKAVVEHDGSQAGHQEEKKASGVAADGLQW